jgi:hypothetical protein
MADASVFLSFFGLSPRREGDSLCTAVWAIIEFVVDASESEKAMVSVELD